MGLRFTCVGGGVGRRNGRLHCWVRTPPRKIRRQYQECKHTSLIFIVVTFCELRFYAVLRSSGPLGDTFAARYAGFITYSLTLALI